MKRITIVATCVADVTETWTWNVPDEIAEQVEALDEEDVDTITALLNGLDIAPAGVESTISGERDRDMQSLEVEELCDRCGVNPCQPNDFLCVECSRHNDDRVVL